MNVAFSAPQHPTSCWRRPKNSRWVFKSPPGSGLSTDWGVGASRAPTCLLISWPLLAARLDGRTALVGRPRGQRKSGLGTEAGDGTGTGLEPEPRWGHSPKMHMLEPSVAGVAGNCVRKAPQALLSPADLRPRTECLFVHPTSIYWACSACGGPRILAG